MDVRVSPEINAILDSATTLSIGAGRYYVGIEHLFEALLDRRDLFDAAFADKHWPAFESVIPAMEQRAWRGAVPSPGEVFYTPRCAFCTSEAANLAQRLRSPKLGAGHLLLAILMDGDSAPSLAMDRLGLGRAGLIEEHRSALGLSAQSVSRSISPAQAEPRARSKSSWPCGPRWPNTTACAFRGACCPKSSRSPTGTSPSGIFPTRQLTCLIRRAPATG
jgi:ATP-dependent Clp protease ATP-binding subunit ClpA